MDHVRVDTSYIDSECDDVAGPVAANDARPPAALCTWPRREVVVGVGEAGLEVEKCGPLAGDAEGACWYWWQSWCRRTLVEEEEAQG